MCELIFQSCDHSCCRFLLARSDLSAASHFCNLIRHSPRAIARGCLRLQHQPRHRQQPQQGQRVQIISEPSAWVWVLVLEGRRKHWFARTAAAAAEALAPGITLSAASGCARQLHLSVLPLRREKRVELGHSFAADITSLYVSYRTASMITAPSLLARSREEQQAIFASREL